MHVLLKTKLEFKAQKITLKMTIRYYKIIKWEEIYVKEKYNQHIRHTIARAV